MEEKFQGADMSQLCGSELYVVVDSKRLEKLHNDPWWKHTRKLHSHLSMLTHSAGTLGTVLPCGSCNPVDNTLRSAQPSL